MHKERELPTADPFQDVAQEEPAGADVGNEEVAALVRRAAEGDRLAWEAIVDRFGGVVWGIARRFRLSTSDCGDVAQATWLRLVEHIDRLNDPSRVGAWLATTARRECLRTVARRDRWLLAADSDFLDFVAPETDAVDHQLLVAETVDVVRRAVETLPEQWRALIEILMVDPPPSYDEVSRMLGMPIGSIGPTRGRSLQRMRAVIEAE